MIFKSKSSIVIILLAIVILFLLFNLNVVTSNKMDEKLKDAKANTNNSSINLAVKNLPSIKSKEILNVIIYIDEYSCGICNNYVLWNFKKISELYPKNTFLFISGNEKYVKNINTNYEFVNKIKIRRFNARNNFKRPIGLLLDSKNKTILELEADFSRIEETDLFFERVKSLLNAVYNKNQEGNTSE